MEKKVSTSPVGKVSKGIVTSPAGKKSTGTAMPPAGKKSTGTATQAASKKHTGQKPATQPEHKHVIKNWCHENMHRYVLAHTHDGWCCDGFVEYIDDEVVCLAVPHHGSAERGYFPGPSYPPVYPYPFFPRNRFYRQVFPLTALLGLSLLPFY